MGTTNVKGLLFSIVLINLSLVGFCGYPRKPVDVPFWKNYEPSWASHHIKFLNGGSAADLILDRSSGTKIVAFFSICFITTFSYALTFKIFLRKKLKIPFCVFEGAGFQSKKSYLFGHFSMKMRLVGGDSAGVVTAFYLSSNNAEHDEIDFEFLGNRTGQPYILQTNVFTGGKGNREQRIYLWFDPTKGYHSYSVLWNTFQIVIFVDDVPIRAFKNSKDLGVKFPFNQPMKIYSSLWDADDWATRGGLEKTDWSNAPFTASYTSFHIDGCEAATPQEVQVCNTKGMRWWDQKAFQDLDALQYRRLRWVRQKYTVYNYCTDKARYPVPPPECTKDRDI
ncbi:putative xyloglucan endotransglucosylase/hydrolase 1 [Capsicum annuum]|uniref:Xyloglucan endotransglucosylase/hydrolase n=1 Tax=Capsicum annuum TaxID=4072 RepID=A0A2G2XXI9_CAPAN|nr:putative xyloglucan endotransglucosylase/hydrolase 1 [Capsicum annuum]